MVLSLLEYKDGTRTIEMILVSTVLPTIEKLDSLDESYFVTLVGRNV